MKPTFYAIAVTITEHKDGHKVNKQLPSFLLNANTHGILNVGHAHKIAREIVNPLNLTNLEVSVTAVPV